MTLSVRGVVHRMLKNHRHENISNSFSRLLLRCAVNRQERARVESKLRRLSTAKPPAVIVGSGSTNDLSFVRSLCRRGIPTIHLVESRLLGSFSRYGLRVRMPGVEDEPQAWLEILDMAAARLGARPVLFPLSDAQCAFVSRNAECLHRAYRFVLPENETVCRILDKREQYAAAEAARIQVPLTFYPTGSEDLARLASEIEYPVILKPYTAHVGRPVISNRKVVVLESADELIAAYSKYTSSGTRFMVQKIVAGTDDAIFWYSGFWDEQGRERAWFTGQKLRQFPAGFGDGSYQRTLGVPVVLEQSRRLLQGLRYRGLVSVEFKCDAGDGSYHLMEMNPRTVSGNELGIRAGVDLPWVAYCHLAGLDATETRLPACRMNVKYVNEEWDAQACAALWKAQELTFAGWIRSWLGTRAWALFAWDDPLPLLVGLWRFIRIGVAGSLMKQNEGSGTG